MTHIEPQIITCNTWDDFKTILSRYNALPRERRNEFWFRGLGNQDYQLQTTLDRYHSFANDTERQRTARQLLDEFLKVAIRIHADDRFTSDNDKLELMARHHGLPSPFLDWSLSPYVAAYFAYWSLSDKATNVLVWTLDRSRIPDSITDQEIDFIDDIRKTEGNRRALAQRGVFMRVSTIREPLESLLAPALTCFLLPIESRSTILAELDEMLLNTTYLFYDLDGAASTAKLRIQSELPI